MAGSQGSGPSSGVAGVVESPAQDGGPVNGAVQLASVDHAQQLRDGIDAGGGEQQQAGPQRGPGRLVG